MIADLSAPAPRRGGLDRHLTVGTGSASASRREAARRARANLDLRGKPGAVVAPLAVGEGRFWGDAVYGFGTRGGGCPGERGGLRCGGVILGLDRQVSADTLVGGAFTYLRAEGSSNGALRDLGRFTNDSYGGTLYGVTRFEAFELRGTASGGTTTGRITRDIAVGSLQRNVGGSLSGPNAGASAFAGYRIASGFPGTAFIPEAGVSYDYLGRGRVAEAGPPGSRWRPATSMRYARCSAPAWPRTSRSPLPCPCVSTCGLLAHELADTTALVQSRLFGTGFTAATSRLSRDGAVLGATLSGEVAPASPCRRAIPARSVPGPMPTCSRPPHRLLVIDARPRTGGGPLSRRVATNRDACRLGIDVTLTSAQSSRCIGVTILLASVAPWCLSMQATDALRLDLGEARAHPCET